MTASAAAPKLVRVSMERTPAQAVVVLDDGTERTAPMTGSLFPASSRLCRIDYLLDQGVLRAETDVGDVVEWDLPSAGRAAVDTTGGRTVVYLDQNMWSAVSNALNGTGRRLPTVEADAALRVAELARERCIILPASAGHMMETSQWTDADRRYQLGLTVASLSRGWQMRDPLQVRRDELHDLFRRLYADGTGPRMRPVFTLDPDVLFGPLRDPGLTDGLAALHGPALAGVALRALTAATVSIDLLLDAEDTQQGPDVGWTAANQRFSDWLDGVDRDGQQKRKSIDAFLLSDLQHDVATQAHAAGITAPQMSSWVRGGFGEGLAGLGSLAFYREVVHARHLNPGTVWEPNDLTDMVFLSCAAAYADVVVCEKHMSGPLRQAFARLGKPKTLYRRLRDAVPAIEAAVSTAEFGSGE